MIKTKVFFLEGRLFSSQSEQFKKFSKSSDWLVKAGPPKSNVCFDHVRKLIVSNQIEINQESNIVALKTRSYFFISTLLYFMLSEAYQSFVQHCYVTLLLYSLVLTAAALLRSLLPELPIW